METCQVETFWFKPSTFRPLSGQRDTLLALSEKTKVTEKRLRIGTAQLFLLGKKVGNAILGNVNETDGQVVLYGKGENSF